MEHASGARGGADGAGRLGAGGVANCGFCAAANEEVLATCICTAQPYSYSYEIRYSGGNLAEKCARGDVYGRAGGERCGASLPWAGARGAG